MSETCMTSRSAATRGMTFLPVVVAAATMASYGPASAATSAAVGSASMWSKRASSASKAFSTPSSLAAASATPRAFEPATRTWTDPPNALAAVSALAVTSFKDPWSCSAIKSVVMVNPANPMRASSKDARLDLQLLDQFGHRADFHASLAPAGLGGLEHLEPGRNMDAQRLGRGLGQRLLFGLHDVGQAGVARLVEA